MTFPGHKVYESIRLDERKTMVANSSQIAKKLLTKNLMKLTSRKTEHFLFDLAWKVNSHTMGFGTSQAIRWSLSRSSITLRSEMTGGGGAPPIAFSFREKGGAGEG